MSGPVVEVKQGILRGAIKENVDGGKYYTFQGIPYAEPPVGELRFKDPQPPKPWNGVYDALEESKMSAQFESFTKSFKGSDDCLYLNVATKSVRDRRPVMVYIHGGGFFEGSNSFENKSPDYLLNKNIVYVSLNYRLGILGFLNMDDEECAGNQGLKDQVAGLKWVKENISIFGGDANNVTIFGESAGAASIHALCSSPLAKGLFHKAIMQSGSILHPWAFKPTNKDVGYAIAKALGKECNSPSEAIPFLRSFPAADLYKAFVSIYAEGLSEMKLYLVPTLDTKSEIPFFPLPIKELVKIDNNIPIIIGYNSHEGILRYFWDTKNLYTQLNDNFEKFIADALNLNKLKVVGVARAIRAFYFGEDEIDESKINEVVQFFGDLTFVAANYKLADIQLQKSTPTYLYKFSYHQDYPVIKSKMDKNIEGVCHADELGCLFYFEEKEIADDSRDRKTLDRMITMWTNFAKNGDPTPTINELIPTKWKPIEKVRRYLLEITDDLECIESPDNEMWKVWKGLFESL